MKHLISFRTLHVLSLIFIICIIAIAFFSYIENNIAYINVMGMGTIELGKCFYRDMLNIRCPSCGLTRSFIALTRLHFVDSLSHNRVGFLVYILFIITLTFNISGVLKTRITGTLGKITAIYGFTVCISLVINWILSIFRI